MCKILSYITTLRKQYNGNCFLFIVFGVTLLHKTNFGASRHYIPSNSKDSNTSLGEGKRKLGEYHPVIPRFSIQFLRLQRKCKFVNKVGLDYFVLFRRRNLLKHSYVEKRKSKIRLARKNIIHLKKTNSCQKQLNS